MSSLLGIPDEKVAGRTTDFTTNKIGGLPDWIIPGSQIPTCRSCSRVMSLAAQLYCPLDCSPYHRTLYLFSCHNNVCWGKQDSWTVLRSQKLDDSFITKTEKPEKVKQSAAFDDWGVAADDWGDDAEDLETGMDDSWSENADVMTGNTSNETEVRVERSGADKGHDLGTSFRDALVGPGAGDDENLSKMSCHSSDSQDKTEVLLTEGGNDLLGEMAQLNVCDFDESCYSEKTDSNIIMDTDSIALKVTEQGVEEMMNLLVRKSEGQNTQVQGQSNSAECFHRNEGLVFESFYISVFNEHETVEENNGHIQELLRNYEQNEGGIVEPLPESKKGFKGGAEAYEEDQVAHGDKYFYKFTKRIAVCPQLCVRYHWNGNPWYISRPDPKMARTLVCGQCGSLAVYELQLLPALINFLHVHDKSDLVIEFGTVIVYSCQGSCWRDTDVTVQEVTFVQPDPDSKLFRQ
ncbi:programmed cell death protein 2-like [Ylistrum balloti]|uniref:programmed cell death protein 2-like n=1 Tax=Ylistrum balloti TaxID=509963 RepID=UPI002905CFEF|nr:programmed cell death protein 2-like [Ylistrum balloti]